MPYAESPLSSSSSEDEFLPRSVLQDFEFSTWIKREAHLKRNEAIRSALATLVRWIVGKPRRVQ